MRTSNCSIWHWW